jgi:hypothetical protein
MAKLIDLFGENQLSGRDLISSAPKSLSDMGVSGTVGVSGVQYALELANRVVPKVDYSDFKNFVFFNSAFDYFNITGDRMIAEYPYDGTYDDFLAFKSASDPYENYIIDAWPRWSGSGWFASGTYAVVGDASTISGRNSLMALSDTGSLALNVPLTLEYRLLFPTPTGAVGPAAGEAWVVCQHFSVSGTSVDFTHPNYTVYVGSGTIGFHLSGSTFTGVYAAGDRVEFPIPNAVSASVGYYMAWIVDPSSGTLSLYKTNSGSSEFPFTNAFQFDTNTFVPLVNVWNFTTGTATYNTGSNTFVAGKHPSASLPSGLTQAIPNFQLSELRYWAMARDSADIFRTYNTRIYKGDPLRLYWRFAEPYVSPGQKGSFPMYVKDYSGYRLNGVINGTSVNNFWVRADTRTGGVGMTQDLGEPLLSSRAQDVIDYASSQQLSGSAYDKNNTNIITNLIPQQYLYIEDEQQTAVMKNLLYLLGRQFDELKTQIDQTVHLLTANYTDFNVTPDALLDEALKFWGWSTKGNFLSKEAFQWFFGLDVLDRTKDDIEQGVFANERLDVELVHIKNAFWRRVLNNLSYLYKTKGTRESVEALFRIYGLDQSVVKLKEYGIKPFVKIETNRINSLKSHDVLKLDGSNGNYGVSTSGQSVAVYDTPAGVIFTIDMQVAFPAFGSTQMPVTQVLGSGSQETLLYFTMDRGGGIEQNLEFPLGSTPGQGFESEHLAYVREWRSGSLTHLGKLIYESDDSNESVVFDNLPIFDGRWYHLSLERREDQVRLDVQFLDTDRPGSKLATDSPVAAAIPYMSSSALSASLFGSNMDVAVGYSLFPAIRSAGQFWTHNVQFWTPSAAADLSLASDVDRLDHTLNPFSRGTETPDKEENLTLLWQFDKLIDSDNGRYLDSSNGQKTSGFLITSGTIPNVSGVWSPNVYDRFNFSYNYIAPPDYNWTEEKIRFLDTPRPDPRDHWAEINDVGIEFNLIDALNEDISMMMSTMDNWNNVIGDPANRYRDNYPQLEKLRQQYFARLSNRINFRVFVDYLDFFDRSFIELIKKLLPARVDFQGAEVVIESHMLERPKVQYGYRRTNPQLAPEGTIVIYGYAPLKTNHYF